MELSTVLQYFATPQPFIAIFLGVLLGYFVGAMPGLSRPTALAVAIPFTYTMSPLGAIALLLGVCKGSAAGGAIAAILLNVPGEPGSAATAIDGYPMAKKGEAGKALQIALYASVLGDFMATAALIAIAQPMASLALKIGPVELCALVVFSLTFVIALSGNSLIKGVIATLAGMFVATIGLDAGSGASRLTFGSINLQDGVPLIALGVGIMACAEMMIQMRDALISPRSAHGDETAHYQDSSLSWSEAKSLTPTGLRSGVIAILVGIAPGLGALIAAFICYTVAKQSSKHPETFGKGEPAGVAATETADNAATIASFIPLFALGIPGSVTAAILIGAFTMQGLAPGPLLFQREAPLVYAIFIALLLSSVALLVIGQYGMRLFVYLAKSPMSLIIPAALTTCMVGVYVEGYSEFAILIVLIFSAVGYTMNRLRFSFVPFIMGFILGPMLELYFRQTLILTHRNPANLIHHPIALFFLLLAAVGVWRFSRPRRPARAAGKPTVQAR